MVILRIVIESFVAGLTLSMLLGPAFFMLLQTSLDRGFRCAVRFALGVFLSDAFLVTLCILGASQLFNNPSVSKVIGVAGGGLLVLIGFYTFRRKVVLQGISSDKARQADQVTQQWPAYWQDLGKGFGMNLANPSVWLFWFVLVGSILAQYTDATGHVVRYRVFLFFAVMLGTVFSIDCLKSFVAARLKKIINEKVVSGINKVVGVVLMLFGAYLILTTFVPCMGVGAVQETLGL
ncbi:MAG: LysE family translocator [Bacteroidales bacterium]|nr:LysE family translocator [Bacteroidales bacterium]MDE7102299.1 LysE family translocator [Bacteroidales bacterium]MDE7338697.1 LysE family translocator [Bacteroidales bacterium]